jgi:hypothetical protein
MKNPFELRWDIVNTLLINKQRECNNIYEILEEAKIINHFVSKGDVPEKSLKTETVDDSNWDDRVSDYYLFLKDHGVAQGFQRWQEAIIERLFSNTLPHKSIYSFAFPRQSGVTTGIVLMVKYLLSKNKKVYVKCANLNMSQQFKRLLTEKENELLAEIAFVGEAEYIFCDNIDVVRSEKLYQEVTNTRGIVLFFNTID